MDLQTGTYNLYRQCPSQQQKLSYINFNKDDQTLRIGFTNITSSLKKVFFDFVNVSGYIAKFLVTGKVYFPVVVLKNQCKDEQRLYFYSTKEKEQFLLSPSDQLQGRIFLYFPPGTTNEPAIYTYNCNLNGYFFVHGETLDKSDVANFNSSLTDLIFIRRKDQDTPFISNSCQGKSRQKQCKKKCKKRSCSREVKECKKLSEILAKDCIPNCNGKKCTDDG